MRENGSESDPFLGSEGNALGPGRFTLIKGAGAMALSSAEVRVKQLDKIRLFRLFGQDILNELAKGAVLRRIPKNKIVTHLGDIPSHIYYIIQGKIRLSAPLSDGREFIFSDLGPGDTFDLTRLFVTRRSNMNAASVVDSDLMQIEVAFMARVFDKHPISH
ncbi:hypothetical protein AJ88_12675 [Mesorhizobium amorphae CCBAU 01583]|nr:hypothetical protein AJ88_12675 [Mesorhizobium amorphae CCBAU 01583]